MSDTDVDMLKVSQQNVCSSWEISGGKGEVRGLFVKPRCLMKAPMVALADPFSIWTFLVWSSLPRKRRNQVSSCRFR